MRRDEYRMKRHERARAAAKAAEVDRVLRRKSYPAYTGWDGSEVWRELHEELSPSPATVLRAILKVCAACRGRALALLRRIPPRFKTLEDYRRWTVEYHDAVNAEVGNPHFGWATAVRLYGWDSPAVDGVQFGAQSDELIPQV